MNYRLIIGLCLGLGWGQALWAQAENLDSIWAVYHSSEAPLEKLKALNGIAWSHLSIDVQRARHWAERSLHVGDSLGEPRQEAVALNIVGLSHYLSGDSERAVAYLDSAYHRAVALNDSVTIAATINNHGAILMRNGIYDEAAELFRKGAAMSKALNNMRDHCVSLVNVGHSLRKMGDYEGALAYVLEGLRISEAEGFRQNLHLTCSAAGELYVLLGDVDKGLSYLNRALDYQLEAKDYYGGSRTYASIGKAYEAQGDFGTALTYFDKGHQMARQLGAVVNIYEAALGKSRALIALGRAGEALRLCEALLDSLAGGRELDYAMQVHHTLAEAHEALGQYDRAYAHILLYSRLSDTLFDERKAKIIQELEFRYRLETKEEENQKLLAQRDADALRIQQRNLVLLIGALALCLVAGALAFIGIRYRQKQRATTALEAEVQRRTADLQASNESLERFAYITSHDLKEPIRNIVGFAQLIERRLKAPAPDIGQVREYLPYIVNSAKQMQTLVEDVLAYTGTFKGDMPAEEIDLNALMAELRLFYLPRIEAGEVSLIWDTLPTLVAPRAALFLVLKNLVENGFKYNRSDKPSVYVWAEQKDGRCRIYVEDNGIGIEPAYHAQIFDMFKRLHRRDEYEGSGLGLAICKKLVAQMGGDLGLLSKADNQGSSFWICLPAECVRLAV